MMEFKILNRKSAVGVFWHFIEVIHSGLENYRQENGHPGLSAKKIKICNSEINHKRTLLYYRCNSEEDNIETDSEIFSMFSLWLILHLAGKRSLRETGDGMILVDTERVGSEKQQGTIVRSRMLPCSVLCSTAIHRQLFLQCLHGARLGQGREQFLKTFTDHKYTVRRSLRLLPK